MIRLLPASPPTKNLLKFIRETLEVIDFHHESVNIHAVEYVAHYSARDGIILQTGTRRGLIDHVIHTETIANTTAEVIDMLGGVLGVVWPAALLSPAAKLEAILKHKHVDDAKIKSILEKFEEAGRRRESNASGDACAHDPYCELPDDLKVLGDIVGSHGFDGSTAFDDLDVDAEFDGEVDTVSLLH